ncbi:MAG: DUF11 domain-containing protein [Deltaproteobacteria bacterium]|nr:MAG: DUF11 domain-containing protein [Deltaproteobacteria bacterium]
MQLVRMWVGILAVLALSAPRAHAADVTFEAGSVLVPMDTDYQDMGMLNAFGLVYALLRSGVPVSWVIEPSKEAGGVDVEADALDHVTAEVVSHGYRGGPFVVAAEDAAAALLIVDLWQASHDTTVHVATAPFTGFVQKQLVAAPTIAVFADGNEDIAFKYLNAAGIPDSLGQTWPSKKEGDKIYPDYPDILNVAEVAGPTDTDHADGALFDGDGDPVYCQLMTMHWSVNDVVDEVVAEMRSFLQHPTHLMAECQAVNAIENNVHGRFLTPNGFVIDTRPSAVQRLNVALAFAQLDGDFETIGGSEPAYSLPEGDTYFDQDIVMLTASDSGPGTRDVWMTGFFEGACPIQSIVGEQSIDTGGGGLPAPSGAASTGEPCTTTVGKVSYLGGHKYDVAVPISTHPKTQGTRLFLNSLFEADCATLEGQPLVTVTKTAPGTTADATVTFTITVSAFGPGAALDATVTDALPEGASFVSASDGGTWDGAAVTWALGNLGVGESATVTVTVSLAAEGSYENVATLRYRVGVSEREVQSEPAVVHYGGDADADGCPDSLELLQGTRTDLADTDGDGFDDCDDTCPAVANPLQDLTTDPAHCSACDRGCGEPPHGTAGCDTGDCVIAACDDGWMNTDGVYQTGCNCQVGDPACDAGAGDVDDADVIEADVIGADAVDGEVIDGDAVEADVNEADTVAVDVVEADTIGPDAAIGDDVSEADVASGDATLADSGEGADGELAPGADGGAAGAFSGGGGCACQAGGTPVPHLLLLGIVMLWLAARRRRRGAQEAS